MISTVILGFAASKSLTALVKTCSSLLSAAKVCHTSIVIGPSSDELEVVSSPPKSKHPGEINAITKISTRPLRFEDDLEGARTWLGVE